MEQLYERVETLFTDDKERGEIWAALLTKDASDRPFYFYGNDDAIRSALKSLVKASQVPADPSASDLLQACDEYSKAIQENLIKLNPHESNFMKKFPSSIREVCILNGSPCLLWEGVGAETVQVDQRLASKINPDVQQGTIVLAPSGSGKTRSLIELACRQHCLYFTGGRPGLGSAQGSDDVKQISDKLSNLFPSGSINRVAVSCAVGALLLARLSIMKLLQGLMRLHDRELTCRDWVFFQLEYPSILDVFRALTDKLCGYISRSNLATSEFAFKNAVNTVADQVGWRGFVVVDEAQLLHSQLVDRFRPGESQRSLLNPLVLELFGFNKVVKSLFVSGTGRSMLKVRDDLRSGSMKPYPLHNVYSLCGFVGEDDITSYVKNFVDVSALDMELISSLFRGRRRWLASALENYMVKEHSTGKASQFFIDFANDIVEKTGPQLGFVRSLADDVQKFYGTVDREWVIRIVFAFYYKGQTDVAVCPTPKSLELVECGLGYLDGTGRAEAECLPMVDDGSPGTQKEPLIISEHLVMRALIKWMPHECLIEKFTDFAQDPSALGSAYETFSLINFGEDSKHFGEHFDKKKPTELFPLVKGHMNYAVYQDTYELVRPKIPIGPLIQDMTENYGIKEWIAAVLDGKTFPIYLHSGTNSFPGPDVMFLLRNISTNVFLPVFLQHRTGRNMKKQQAFGTLVVWDIYKEEPMKQQEIKMLFEWCRTGYMQIVVGTHLQQPKELKPEQLFTIVNQEPAKSHESMLEGMEVVPPFAAIIAGRHTFSFISDKVLNEVDKVKRRAVEKRKQQQHEYYMQKKMSVGTEDLS